VDSFGSTYQKIDIVISAISNLKVDFYMITLLEIFVIAIRLAWWDDDLQPRAKLRGKHEYGQSNQGRRARQSRHC
jgi:hypothetical protein